MKKSILVKLIKEEIKNLNEDNNFKPGETVAILSKNKDKIIYIAEVKVKQKDGNYEMINLNPKIPTQPSIVMKPNLILHMEQKIKI